jgi:hypothetical protein
MPTPYQPYLGEVGAGVHGGYSDRQLAPDTFQVRFHGNEFTSRQRVEDFMLYRAAELVIQQGFDWFRIVDHHLEHERETYVERTPAFDPVDDPSYVGWRPHWRYYRGGSGWTVWHPEWSRRFWAEDVDVHTVESFEAEAEIVAGRGAIPAQEPKAFDARQILAELAPRIERPPAR